jgi:hypothetical protein
MATCLMSVNVNLTVKIFTFKSVLYLKPYALQVPAIVLRRESVQGSRFPSKNK